MSMKLLNDRLSFLIVFVKRSVVIQSDIDLGNKMKLFNDNKQFKKALELFDKQMKNNMETSSSLVITQALKACAHLGDLQRGSTIHRLISSRIKDDFYISTSLIHLYMQCGDVKCAQSIFDTTTKKTSSMHGAMMKGYIKNNQPNKAINLFHTITNPSEIVINLLFNACAQIRTKEALDLVKKVSNEMPKSFHLNSYLLASLLDALVKCGDIKQAESLFDRTNKKILSMYGAMMKGYIQHNQPSKAFEIFSEINNPDEIILVLLFNACAQIRTTEALDLVKKVSNEMPKSFYLNSYLLASLLDALMKCGDIKQAESLFNRSNEKVLSMYGAMMKGYIENNQPNKAINLFNTITNPSEIVINLLFHACAQIRTKEALDLVKKVSNEMPKSFCLNPNLLTSLLDALMKCGDVKQAESLFDRSNEKVLSMYGVMMKGYIQHNQPNKAINLFNTITNPSEIVINLLFHACAQLGTKEALDLVKKVSNEIPKSFHLNPYLLTSLLDALMKCGDIKQAESLFNRSNEKVLSMYGAMMKGYIQHNQPNKAINLFNTITNPSEIVINLLFHACAQIRTKEALDLVKKVSDEMPKSFCLNPNLLTSLLDALMKCGDVKQAESLFDRSNEKVLSMYGAMMKGYIENNMADTAIDIFNRIKDPDEVNIILLFNACAQLGTAEALNLTKKVAEKIPKSFYLNLRLLSSLLDALIKCGDIKQAESLFDRSNKKVLSMYGALMSGFNKEENPLKTLNLFNKMKIDGFNPDIIIYGCVIKALSQIGDYSLSKSFVEEIPKSLFVDNQIQNALIDMWGKTGCVDHAKEIFEKISQPDQIGYTAMINCYGLNGMGIRAIKIYHQMPKELIDEVTHICVLNACSHSGLVNEAYSIFRNIPMKTEKIFSTMIDCLSRASLFKEAQNLIDEFERDHSPASSMYMALLSGARNVNNKNLSEQIFDRIKKLFPQLTNSLTSAAILLANVYGSSGDFENSSNIRIQLNKSGAKKQIGLTFTVVDGQVYQFRAHDQSHPRSDEIYAEIKKISKELIEHGYQYDSSWITRPLYENETVASVLSGHSERLAMAWNFVANPNTTRIQLTKNLRVCGDCHQATKLIAKIRQCEIIVRDANRIHHFHTNGKCSCNDYF